MLLKTRTLLKVMKVMNKMKENKSITRKRASRLATLLAGLSLAACAPATQQRSYSPEDNQVSPELLQELSDSVDSYTARLETAQETVIAKY